MLKVQAEQFPHLSTSGAPEQYEALDATINTTINATINAPSAVVLNWYSTFSQFNVDLTIFYYTGGARALMKTVEKLAHARVHRYLIKILSFFFNKLNQ